MNWISIYRKRRRRFVVWVMLLTMLMSVMPHVMATPVKAAEDTQYDANVYAGSSRTFVIKPDGTLWGKGYRFLGDGTTQTRDEFIQILPDEGPFAAVADGGEHTLALTQDGSVWAWGSNTQGELGNGSTSQYPLIMPIEVQFPEGVSIKEIAAGTRHSLALSTDGQLWEWGLSPHHDLTSNRKVSPAQVLDGNGDPITNIRSIEATQHSVFAVTTGGELWAWGNNSNLQLGFDDSGRHGPAKLTIRQVESIAAGSNHTVALLADGTVWGWGRNNYGELGTGIELSTRTYIPTPVNGLNNTVSIYAGNNGTLALDAEGHLWALGNDKILGLEGSESSAEPVQVGGEWGEDIALLSVSRSHVLAVKRDGSIWGWGSNNFRQLISEATNTIETPTQMEFDSLPNPLPLRYVRLDPHRGQTQVPVDEVVRIEFDRDIAPGERLSEISITDAAGQSVGGLTPNAIGNELVIEHDAFDMDTVYEVIVPQGAVVAANGRSNKEIRWTFETISLAVPEVDRMSPADGGEIAPDGVIRVYFTSPVTAGPAIEEVKLVNADGQQVNHIRAVSEGNRLTILHDPLQEHAEYTATIPADAVRNEAGNGSEPLQWTFTTGAAEPPLDDENAVLGTGDQRTFISEADGSVWAWGRNQNGVLGSGTQVQQNSPMPVKSLMNVKEIVVGQNYSAALKQDGTVWTWGSQRSGELGNGTEREPNLLPVQVAGLQDIIQIAAGWNHMVALKQDGTVWTWGNGLNGRLGHGTSTSSPLPVQVEGLAGIKAVAAGASHTLAIGEDGRVWAWGFNHKGQLGDGTTESSSIPVQVTELTHVTAIAAGWDFSLALRQDGTVWGWGLNSKGQLGQDPAELENSRIPVEITELPNVQSLTGGYETSYALQQDGTVWGWGSGRNGMLGTGSEDDATEPVQILNDVAAMDASLANQGHAVALKSDGEVWGWGFNGGQLYQYAILNDSPDTSILSPAVTMYGNVGSDQAPVVIEASPEQGEQEVEVDAPVLLTFNEPIHVQSGRSLDEVMMTTSGLVPEPVENVRASLDGRTLVIEHDPLQVRNTYNVTIPAGLIVDEAGNANKQIEFWFRTIQGDMESPQPIVLVPDNQERNVSTERPIEVQFDEPVNPGTWLNNIELVDAQGVKWDVTPIVSGDKLVIGHDPLDYSTEYTVNIPANAVQDELGNVNEPFSWTFRTRGEAGEEVEVHFINVGQGDGIYIKLPGNVDVVIDSGHWNSPHTVVNYLDSQNVDDIEYLIATHMDADHIGGMANVLNRYTVETIIDNGMTASTQTFMAYQQARLNEIASEEAEYIRVQGSGDLQTFQLTDQVELRLIGPVQRRGGANDNSIVAILDTGEIEVMLTGDAVAAQEADMLAYADTEGIDLRAEVLKVAHHGSASSTSSEFVQAVQPMSAVISVGSNSYGHPTQEVLDRLTASGATIYRTDRDSIDGAIVMVTDGASYKINGEWIIPPDSVEPATSKPIAEKINWSRSDADRIQLTGLAGASQNGATIRVYTDFSGEEFVAETIANEDGAFTVEFTLEENVTRIYITATEAGRAESAASVLLLEDHNVEANAGIALRLPDGPYAVPGEPIRVLVEMEDYTNIYGAQFKLKYDPELLSLVDSDPLREGMQISMGGLFADYGHAEVLNSAEADAGIVNFASMLIGESQGISGERGVLAELQFVPIPQADVETEIALIAEGTKIASYPEGDLPSWKVDPKIGQPAVVSIQGGEPGETVVYLESDKQTLALGETVTFRVMADEYEDLYGVQLRLDYDPTRLRPVDQNGEAAGIQASEGTIFQAQPVEVVVNEAVETNGKAAYAVVLTGDQAGVSGRIPRSIAEWEFEPIGPSGSATVKLVEEQVKMAGQPREDGEPVKLSFEMGQVVLNVNVEEAQGGDTEPPGWPSNAEFAATERTTDSITLQWSEATDNVEVAHYELYVGTEKYTTVTDTTYRVDGLNPGTRYTFQVRAVDTSDNVSESLSLEASTLSEGNSGGGGNGGGSGGGGNSGGGSGGSGGGSPGGGQPSSSNHVWEDTSAGLTAHAANVRTDTIMQSGKETIVIMLDGEHWQQGFEHLSEKDPDDRKLRFVIEDSNQPILLQVPVAELNDGLDTAPDTVIVLQVGDVIYELPLELLADHSNASDEQATLNIVVDILQGDERQVIEEIIANEGASLVSDIAEFEIFVMDGDDRTDVSTFPGHKVTRIFRISGSVNPNVSTGVRIENGELTFIPSTFERRGSVTYVVLTNDRNSVYAVIEHRKTFQDIAQHWAKADIELLASKLVVQGVSESQYAPDRNITRAELTALLIRALGLRAEGTSGRFSDVPTNAWYVDEVNAALQSGIVTGYPDGTFRPDQTITREETAVLISRAIAYAGSTGSPRADSDILESFVDRNRIGNWAIEELSMAVQAGIVSGLPDGSFRPEQQATRAEAAVMLKRLLQYVGYIDRE